MAELDTSIYKPFIQTPQDIALKQQQLQAGNTDIQSKKLIFATQLLSGAADQQSYDGAKQFLQKNGIDTSAFAPDFATGKQQAQQLRLAQSPLGSLLNTSLKMDANGNMVSIAGGNLPGDPNARTTALLQGGAGALMAPTPNLQTPIPRGIPPISAGVPNQPLNIPRGSQTASMAGIPTPPQEMGVQTNGTVGGAPLSGQMNQQLAGAVNGLSQNDMQIPPMPLSGQMNQQLAGAVNGLSQNDMQIPPMPQYTPDPSKTLESNKADFQNQMEAWKADPRVIAAQAKAGDLGKAGATVQQDAIAAGQSTDQIMQNIEALKKLAPVVPQQRFGISPDVQEMVSQNFGDQKSADAAKQFKLINESQGINAIKALAATGQIRMNQRMEAMINRGYLIDPNASPQEKLNQAASLEAELKNAAINTQNVNAQMNGGPVQPYNPVPTGLEAPTDTGGGWSYKGRLK